MRLAAGTAALPIISRVAWTMAAAIPRIAQAQSYPARPVHMIVGRREISERARRQAPVAF
jgi:hypothetical protein